MGLLAVKLILLILQAIIKFLIKFVVISFVSSMAREEANCLTLSYDSVVRVYYGCYIAPYDECLSTNFHFIIRYYFPLLFDYYMI